MTTTEYAEAYAAMVQPLVLAAQAYLATVVACRRAPPNGDAIAQADAALSAAQAELLRVAREGQYPASARFQQTMKAMTDALKQIADVPPVAFSKNPLVHAERTVTEMRRLAAAALADL